MCDFEITKREILLSVAIICIMLVVGLLISGGISERAMERQQMYYTAVRIESERMFQHCLETDIGNALAYGKLVAIDPVTFSEIGGEYSYVEKVKEKYTRHERTVTKTRTTVDGKTETYTEVEVYYSWDKVDAWDKHSNTMQFLGVEFRYGEIPPPLSYEITKIRESSDIRYVYYGRPVTSECTIFTNMFNGAINDTDAYYDCTIEEVIEMKSSDFATPVFWFLWFAFTVGIVFAFYSLENRWLD